MPDSPKFSFVLPAYNEEENIGLLAPRLLAVGRSLGAPFEIIWINDGSTDKTGEILARLEREHPEITAIEFSRNFGHMAALTAGFKAARATGAVICLDCDGQHPPELIPEMIRLWKDGSDIVQTIRRNTADQSIFKRLSSKFFYTTINVLGDVNLPEGAADFRLMDRQVIDALNNLPEIDRFIRGLIQWVGFKQTFLPYDAPARLKGKTKYSIMKMCLFALTGITSFSIKPLRMSIVFGIIMVLIAMFYAIYVIICIAAHAPLVLGWSSQVMATLTLNGMTLIMIGIMSEYLGRLYTEAKHRPIFIIKEKRDSEHDR